MARGDQIYAMRHFLNIDGMYQHHGIDCGDGTVIHYRKPSETIERTSLETFSQGNPIYVKSYPLGYTPDVVVERALSRMGEKKYNLLFNNCEHFATWCKTGVNESQQIRNFIPVMDQINVDSLLNPLAETLQDAPRDRTPMLLNEALAQIKVAWDNIQPQYIQAKQEMESWDKVARLALQKNREDLARAAIKKKLYYQQQLAQHEERLQKLAKMTETLVKNSQA